MDHDLARLFWLCRASLTFFPKATCRLWKVWLYNYFGEPGSSLVWVSFFYDQLALNLIGKTSSFMECPVKCLNQTRLAGSRRAKEKNVQVIWHVVIVKARNRSRWQHLVWLNVLTYVRDLLPHDLHHNRWHRHSATLPLRATILIFPLDLTLLDDRWSVCNRRGSSIYLEARNRLPWLKQFMLFWVWLHLNFLSI